MRLTRTRVACASKTAMHTGARVLRERESGAGLRAAGDDRLIALAADSLGSLRRDLVENLGLEGARGVLMRAAYWSGRSDARRERASRPAPSGEELIRAKGGFCDLGGRARARLTRIDIDRDAGTLFVAGEWLDSYEVAQHLKHFGPAARPVCWTLEGYASGYAAELLGREVLCVETRCRARGDPACRFELKPLAEW